MKDFIEYMTKSIVSQPDQVIVTETAEADTQIYLIKVADEDMGRVIGKEGRTIQSIRNLAKSKAIREQLKIRIDLDDPRQPIEQ